MRHGVGSGEWRRRSHQPDYFHRSPQRRRRMPLIGLSQQQWVQGGGRQAGTSFRCCCVLAIAADTHTEPMDTNAMAAPSKKCIHRNRLSAPLLLTPDRSIDHHHHTTQEKPSNKPEIQGRQAGSHTMTTMDDPFPQATAAAAASATSADDDSDGDMERELFGLAAGEGLAEAAEDEEEEGNGDGEEAAYRWLERLVAESAGVRMSVECVVWCVVCVGMAFHPWGGVD